ncbi:threonylcarbamoyl-AMP synthase [Thiomicrorhabdus immobilis]|uniref:Threonylcarbamoyl-AMP synthase n=1 Tax=Thiomicrorhabdus immobilis TaxID=2791037 RepID=A0ABM7MA68_9GAMM|nr:L-threonylcarbamoyladenylate synthase [Thiomicrorhabdus immobilis]BCN92231.1 threonylcarbamoyl-AMP synthase [Thiomicrorhabdus immobilis]
MKTVSQSQITQAVELLKQGEVIAYPTEAVYGLGCDPFKRQAVEKLFHVKQRPMEKGVILVAANVEQILDWVELQGCDWEQSVLQTWPGPMTWVLPLKQNTKTTMPEWITGGRDTVAIRVSDHPVVQQLCLAFGGPIVSTSANLSNHPPAISCQEVEREFKNQVFCISAELGGLLKPTQIREAKTGQVLR